MMWPLVVVTGLVLFRREISDVLHRVRRGKVLGQEVELDAAVTALVRDAGRLEAMPLAVVPTAEPEEVTASPTDSSVDMEIEEVLSLAAMNPRLAVMQLSVAIERETRWLLAATGHLQQVERATSLGGMVAALRQTSLLAPAVLDVMAVFADVRNRVVHGAADLPERDVLRAVDAGFAILRSLAAAPRERNYVWVPAVDLYTNPEATAILNGVAGVVLRTVSAGGSDTTHRVFPTSRRDYVKDLEVSWEWNRDRIIEAAWYRDPETQEIRSAWSGSMEFAGRHESEL